MNIDKIEKEILNQIDKLDKSIEAATADARSINAEEARLNLPLTGITNPQ